MRTSKFHAFTAGVAVGAAVTALTVFCAGQARADTDTYLSDLQAVGVTIHNATAAMNAGIEICNVLATTNMNGLQIAQSVAYGGVTLWDAERFVAMAAKDLCPQYMPTSARQAPTDPGHYTVASAIA